MKEYGPFALRLGVGGIFLYAGIIKLMNPSMVAGMLSGMGFPGATFWAWLLIAVEVLGGAAVLLGFRLKWATVPLAIVMVVAMATAGQFMVTISLLAGLVSLWLTGPGKWALNK